MDEIKFKGSDPDVLFLIDGEVGIEIDHLWRTVRWSGVPCDLHINRKKQQVKHTNKGTLWVVAVDITRAKYPAIEGCKSGL